MKLEAEMIIQILHNINSRYNLKKEEVENCKEVLLEKCDIAVKVGQEIT